MTLLDQLKPILKRYIKSTNIFLINVHFNVGYASQNTSHENLFCPPKLSVKGLSPACDCFPPKKNKCKYYTNIHEPMCSQAHILRHHQTKHTKKNLKKQKTHSEINHGEGTKRE